MFYIVKNAVTPFKKYSRYNRINTSVILYVCCLCSSEQSAKAKTQKELFKTLKELKYHLPPDKRSKGRASTLHTLRYALRCVKEVKGQTTTSTIYAVFLHFCILILCKSCMFFFVFAANEEYYQMLMINDSQPSGLDVSSYTIEEINSITSEYTLKNAVSRTYKHYLKLTVCPETLCKHIFEKVKYVIFKIS